MTATPRILNAPTIILSSMASTRTAMGSHGYSLADLADDAADGHPGQRATIDRNAGGTFRLFTDPRTTALLYELAVTVSWRNTWVNGDFLQVELVEITDGTHTVTSASHLIPDGLNSGDTGIPPGGGRSRLDAMNRQTWYFDRSRLITAGLSATLPWTWKLVITCATTVWCEAVELAEMSRFAVSGDDNFGADPRAFRGRTDIDTGLSRVGLTLEAAYDLGRRTYHAIALPEASPNSVTSSTYVAIPGAQNASGSDPQIWRVRGRLMGLGDTPVKFGCRYKTSGAGNGSLKLTTGAGAYTLTLPGTSGAWASIFTGAGAILAASQDDLAFTAKVASGTLYFTNWWVLDDP